MSAADRFERLARSKYDVSAEELSAALVVEVNGGRFKACRNGRPLLLPRSAMSFLMRLGIVRYSRGHTIHKHDVDWKHVEALFALRKKSHGL